LRHSDSQAELQERLTVSKTSIKHNQHFFRFLNEIRGFEGNHKNPTAKICRFPTQHTLCVIHTFHISLSPHRRNLKITRIVHNDSQPEWWRTLPNAYEVSLLIYPSKTLDVGVLGEVKGRGGYEFWGWKVEGETILPPVSYILLGTVSDSTRAQLINSVTDIS